MGRGGDCFVWGDGDSGQLGLGTLENRPQVSINNSFPSVMQVSAGANNTAVLTRNGQVSSVLHVVYGLYGYMLLVTRHFRYLLGGTGATVD